MNKLLLSVMGAEDLGLEPEVQGEVNGDVVEVVEQTIRAELAEVSAEIAEVAAEVSEIAETVDEVSEIAEETQEAVEGMERLMASGNYNADAMAALYGRAMSGAQRVAKFTAAAPDLDDHQRMGAEHLGDASTAQMMTRSGVEGIGETLKKWATTAIEFIKNLFNRVWSFLVGIFNKANGLQKRHDYLKGRLDRLEGTLSKEVKLGKWNNYVDYKTNGLNNISKTVVEAKKSLSGVINAVGVAIAAVEKPDFTVDALRSSITSLNAAVADAGKSFSSNSKNVKKGKTDFTIFADAGFTISVSVYAGTVDSFANATDAFRQIRASKSIDDKRSKKLADGSSVKSKVDKAALYDALKKVNELIAAVRKSKDTTAFNNSHRDRLIGTLNNLSAANKDSSSENNSRIGAIRAVSSCTATITTTLNSLSVDFADALLGCVAAHV